MTAAHTHRRELGSCGDSVLALTVWKAIFQLQRTSERACVTLCRLRFKAPAAAPIWHCGPLWKEDIGR